MKIDKKKNISGRQCPWCGKDPGFRIKKDREVIRLGSPLKFCSHKCQLNFRHKDKIIYLICPVCRKKFRKYTDGVSRKHCSMKCYNKVRGKNLPKYQISIKEGKNYRVKKINGKQIYLHRWIMEQHLGRPLTRKEVVHHINGDRHDNRVENLMVMSQSEHIKLEHEGWRSFSEPIS